MQIENDKKNTVYALRHNIFLIISLPLSLLSHVMPVLRQQSFLFRWFCQDRNIQHALAFRLAFVLRQLQPRSFHSFCELFYISCYSSISISIRLSVTPSFPPICTCRTLTFERKNTELNFSNSSLLFSHYTEFTSTRKYLWRHQYARRADWRLIPIGRVEICANTCKMATLNYSNRPIQNWNHVFWLHPGSIQLTVICTFLWRTFGTNIHFFSRYTRLQTNMLFPFCHFNTAVFVD